MKRYGRAVGRGGESSSGETGGEAGVRHTLGQALLPGAAVVILGGADEATPEKKLEKKLRKKLKKNASLKNVKSPGRLVSQYPSSMVSRMF